MDRSPLRTTESLLTQPPVSKLSLATLLASQTQLTDSLRSLATQLAATTQPPVAHSLPTQVRKVQELEANAERQQKQIEALTAGLQKVSAPA
jgi:ABC-type transporter Mla subunit MlaD